MNTPTTQAVTSPQASHTNTPIAATTAGMPEPMRRVRVDKVASVARSCALGAEVRVSDRIPCEEGVVVAV